MSKSPILGGPYVYPQLSIRESQPSVGRNVKLPLQATRALTVTFDSTST